MAVVDKIVTMHQSSRCKHSCQRHAYRTSREWSLILPLRRKIATNTYKYTAAIQNEHNIIYIYIYSCIILVIITIIN